MKHTNTCCMQDTGCLNINSGGEYRNISVFKGLNFIRKLLQVLYGQ